MARTRLSALGLGLCALALAPACVADGLHPDEADWSTLRLGASADLAVTVHYEIDCPGGSSFDVKVGLEDEGLPPHVDWGLAGQPFADVFVVAPEGQCTVTATALGADGFPVAGCLPATATVDVASGQTTEALLVIVCDAEPGAVDIVTVVNHQPVLHQVLVDPDTTVTTCTSVKLTPTATDSDGDPLNWQWTVVGPAAGSAYSAEPVEPEGILTWTPFEPGEWTLTVVVDDGLGLSAEADVVFTVEGDPCG